MADFQDSSDSENEVFFGPVTEKERRKMAELAQRKSDKPLEHTSAPTVMSHQNGEEGLHALAMAAQMLSISSDQKDREANVGKPLNVEIMKEKKQVESSDLASSKSIPIICIEDDTNDGNHLEIDAVKFLTQRLPENQNNSGDDMGNSVYSQKNSCEIGDPHHTSFASTANDSHDEIICLDDSLDIPQDYSNQHLINHDCLSVGLNILEANVKMEDLRMVTCNPNVDIANLAIKEVKIEDISTSNRLINMKYSHIDWTDANEISRSDFGIKVSDNEEDMEKLERNLKVEEIIKFLADEEVEVKSENGISSNCFPINKLPPTKSSNVTESILSDELPDLKCNLLQDDSLKVSKEEVLNTSPKKIVKELPETVGKSLENEKLKTLSTPKQVHPKSALPGKKCSIPLPQRDCRKLGTPFKTPTSKLKPASASKIPHLSPATSSHKKNNKFAGIVSPVAKYIHGSPTVLIASNKVIGRNLNSASKPKSTKKPTGIMVESRGAENVDVNNFPCVPIAENVHCKNATPLKIISPNPDSNKKSGPRVLVFKHLGQTKMSSLKIGGDSVIPLDLQQHSNISPDDNVSILLGKEIGTLSHQPRK